MNGCKIYLKKDSEFSNHIEAWAHSLGLKTEEYSADFEDLSDVGMVLINQNQDIDKLDYDLHELFDKKHIPTQKIDINGTLQVAVSNFQMWLRNYKCKNILFLGADDLTKNDNLDRFLARIGSPVNA